eukprot:Opistho-1_new@24663
MTNNAHTLPRKFSLAPRVGLIAACLVAMSAPAVNAQSTTSTTWKKIADEGRIFWFSGTRSVRYGADTRWVYKTVKTGGLCTTTYFKDDPARGTTKSCQIPCTLR